MSPQAIPTWILADPEFIDRFWKKVKRLGSKECWPYLARFRSRDGYGRVAIYFGNRVMKVMAHRVAYQLVNGPTRDGYLVCHTCDNRECCNPAHLYQGTHADNSEDMVIRNRSLRGDLWHQKMKRRSYRGEWNPAARYSTELINEVKQRLSKGETPSQISRSLPVKRMTISNIKHGRSWQ